MVDLNRYRQILEECSAHGARLIVVTKDKPVKNIRVLYDAGHHAFGENRVQELLAKHETLPTDIEWHMIGHLQTNKVKQIVPFVTMIQSIDSEKLLREVNRRAGQNGRIVDVLLQVHIAQEETKFGFSPEELKSLLSNSDFSRLTNIRVCGLMGIATLTDHDEQVRSEFKSLKTLFDELRAQRPQFTELSIGMSSDYRIAIEEGSTMVRVGSLILGER